MAIIVPTASTIQPETSALRLARYAQRIQYAECAFWGVAHEGNDAYQCREIWTKTERDYVSWALAEAQREIEVELGYFLNPKWVVGKPEETEDEFLVDWQPFPKPHGYSNHLMTRWGMVLEAGIRAEETLGAAAVIDYTSEPATITVNPVSATLNIEEVEIYHTGTDFPITPSAISLAGNTLTIRIPRCRLVAPGFVENPPGGWDYNDLTKFAADVDVKRIYNDPSVNALLAHQTHCQQASCSEQELSACIYINQPKIGHIQVNRANYSGGSWTRASSGWCCKMPKIARLYYRAGLRALDEQLEDTIMRLAHSKMPDEPCGCDITQRLWERDRNVPDVITPERANNPFGINDGAWMAWKFTNRRRLVRTRVL